MPNTGIYKLYKKRFVFRVFVLVAVCLLYVFNPQSFSVMTSDYFFKGISVLHGLWIIWVFEMILQLAPLKGLLTMGSLKQFKVNYVHPRRGFDQETLRQYHNHSLLNALKVLAVWLIITVIIGMLSFKTVLMPKELLLLTAIFYVSDLFCVLYWCPFQRLIMKNRCCTTCRIYNWDSLMIFTPMVFINGFFSLSLFFLSVIVFIIWEIRVFKYPERFWDGANDNLNCAHCADKICQGKSRIAFQENVEE